jgi:hypothetical protein
LQKGNDFLLLYQSKEELKRIIRKLIIRKWIGFERNCLAIHPCNEYAYQKIFP